MKFKGTKGNFIDGTTSWKVGKRKTNGVDGFEIHYSDDGECVTDHVYKEEDAKIIAIAPELLEACILMKSWIDWKYKDDADCDINLDNIQKVINKSLL